MILIKYICNTTEMPRNKLRFLFFLQSSTAEKFTLSVSQQEHTTNLNMGIKILSGVNETSFLPKSLHPSQ